MKRGRSILLNSGKLNKTQQLPHCHHKAPKDWRLPKLGAHPALLRDLEVLSDNKTYIHWSDMLCSRGRATYKANIPDVLLHTCILSTKEPQSPFPRILPTKALGLNFSNSCMCSPVPIKVMGLFVAATAPRAPPPLAWPSIFVKMTLPTCISALVILFLITNQIKNPAIQHVISCFSL